MSSVWSIRRSTSDKKVAGVCGGVARHWNVDPILVRVGWVLLAFSGGVGVVLYIAAWLLVPADGATSSVMDEWTKGQTRSWPREAWIAIVAVASLVTFAIFSSTTSIGFGPAVVLALIWYFGYYKSRARQSPPPPPYAGPPTPGEPTRTDALGSPSPQEPFRYPGPATPFTQAAEAWQQRVADMRRSGTGPAPSQPPTAAVPPSAPAGQQGSPWQTYPYHSGPSSVQDPVSPEVLEAAARANFLAAPDPVGLYTAAAPVKAAAAPSRRTAARSLSARRLRLVGLILLGLTLLGLAIADSVGVPVTPVIYVSAALLVVGLTLIAATWFGRARGILPVGLVLLMVLLGMLVGRPAGGPFLHDFTYTSAGQLAAEPVQVQHGLVDVDLSQVDLTSDATFHADLGRGAMEITVPANTNLVLDYRIGSGAVMDNNATIASGNNQSGVTTLGETSTSGPTLTLDVDVDAGIVSVKR